MDCAQFDEVIHELDRPGTQGGAVRDVALAHAESCDRCATLLTQVEWLDFNLLRLKLDVALSEPPARLESNLVQEFRLTAHKSARRGVLRQLAILGAAAAVLLVLGLSLRHHNPLLISESTSGAKLSAVQPSQVPAAPPPARESVLHPAVNSAAAQNRRADLPEVTRYDVPAIDAASFVQLPYADDSLADEGGAIVRVQISRSALASFGLPVVEGDGTERLQADLVLSADGTPQAIRLVSPADSAEED